MPIEVTKDGVPGKCKGKMVDCLTPFAGLEGCRQPQREDAHIRIRKTRRDLRLIARAAVNLTHRTQKAN